MKYHSALHNARRQLCLVAGVQVLAMSVWFSTAAVVPTLTADWQISTGAASWLTTAVQVGFVAGALTSAVFNLGDRIPIHLLIAVSATLAAVTNLMVPLAAHGLSAAIPLRFVTGLSLAGVYPTGVKLMASWFSKGRGLAMGVLVGALTLGSGAPHIVNGIGELPWRAVLEVTSGLALVAAAAALLLRDGPLLRTGSPFHPSYVVEMFRDRAQRAINYGYFGHMWELYALWTWFPTYFAASLLAWHAKSAARSLVELSSFGIIGFAGAIGCVLGGVAAHRLGSIRVARQALITSGACAAFSGVVFGVNPVIVIPFLTIWGLAVIADSAQYSAALSTAADPRYVGTALTAQMATGFLITVASIRLLPSLASLLTWRWSFTILALGPALGLFAIRGIASNAFTERGELRSEARPILRT